MQKEIKTPINVKVNSRKGSLGLFGVRLTPCFKSEKSARPTTLLSRA
jgi:hypothetical protein